MDLQGFSIIDVIEDEMVYSMEFYFISDLLVGVLWIHGK